MSVDTFRETTASQLSVGDRVRVRTPYTRDLYFFQGVVTAIDTSGPHVGLEFGDYHVTLAKDYELEVEK